MSQSDFRYPEVTTCPHHCSSTATCPSHGAQMRTGTLGVIVVRDGIARRYHVECAPLPLADETVYTEIETEETTNA